MNKIRPSSLQPLQWNRGDFPFDAFEWTDPHKNAVPILKVRSPWIIEFADGTIPGSALEDGAVTNSKVNASASISASKIALTEITSLPNLDGLTGSQLADGTVTEQQVSAATLTSKSLKFTDNVHENDDPLPDGDLLLDCFLPSAKWNTGLEPEEKSIAYEPKMIGSVSNPRVKTNFHGAIGVWKATTNLISTQDVTAAAWTKASGGTASTVYNDTLRATVYKFLSDGTAGSNAKITIVPTATTVSIQAVIIKGDAQETDIGIYDSTAPAWRGMINYVWSTGSATAILGTVNNISVEVIEAGSIVRISGSVPSITVGNAHEYYIYATYDITEAKFSCFYQMQAEDSSYPTPFTPSTRPAGSLTYNISATNEMTIEGWIRPYFNYDIGSYVGIFKWLASDGTAIEGYYDYATDKMVFAIHDAGWTNYRFEQTDSLNSAAVNSWNHFKMVLNYSAQTAVMYWNGVTDPAKRASSGSVSGFALPSQLSIGIGLTGTSILDGLICDIRIKDSADTSTTHYTTGRPYYDETSLPCANFGARLSASGLDLYRGSIDIVDELGREILISNKHGLKAKDACGNVIHDITDATVQSGDYYGGHLTCFNAGAIVDFSSTPTGSWTEFAPSKRSTTNTRIARFYAYLRVFTTDVGLTDYIISSGHCYVSLRPKGSTWSSRECCVGIQARPYHYRYATSSGACAVEYYGYIECPLGTDGKCEYYLEGDIGYNDTSSFPYWNSLLSAVVCKLTQLGGAV